jgi:hypoxia up-regulated 1
LLIHISSNVSAELGKFINGDEAAALGAVYQAAHLTKGFKVAKFAIRDACFYPIQVDFPKEVWWTF